MSHYAFPTYTYVVVGRGRILETKTVTPIFDETNATEYRHRFSFHANFDYAPTATVIVYLMRKQSIVSTKINVDLKDDFKNFIDMNVTPNIAKPGQIMAINIKSNPNSYIGLLGMDKSVLILRGGNDLTHDEIWNALASMDAQVKGRPYDYSEGKKQRVYYYNPWKDFSVSTSTIVFFVANRNLICMVHFSLSSNLKCSVPDSSHFQMQLNPLK